MAEFNGTALAPGNRNTAYGTSSDSVTTYTANTAINQNMALQAAWGSTTGAPTLTSDTAIFKRIA